MEKYTSHTIALASIPNTLEHINSICVNDPPLVLKHPCVDSQYFIQVYFKYNEGTPLFEFYCDNNKNIRTYHFYGNREWEGKCPDTIKPSDNYTYSEFQDKLKDIDILEVGIFLTDLDNEEYHQALRWCNQLNLKLDHHFQKTN